MDILVKYKIPGSNTPIDISNKVSIGVSVIESSSTDNHNLSLVFKDKETDVSLPMWTMFFVEITDESSNTLVYEYLLQVDQLDKIGSNITGFTFIHNLSLSDPILFTNFILCPSMTFSTDVDNQNTFLNIITDVLIKTQVSDIFVIDNSVSELSRLAPEFTFDRLTLREILEGIYGFLQLIPRIELNFENNIATLTVQQISTKIIDVTNYTFEETNDVNTYFTSTKTKLNDALTRNNTTVTYPSKYTFTGLNADEEKFTADSNSFFEVDKPISFINKVYLFNNQNQAYFKKTVTYNEYTCIDNKTFNGISEDDEIDSLNPNVVNKEVNGKFSMKYDISRFIKTDSEYASLEVNERDNVLSYSIGSRRIIGINKNEDSTLGVGIRAFREVIKTVRDNSGDFSSPEAINIARASFDNIVTAWFNVITRKITSTEPSNLTNYIEAKFARGSRVGNMFKTRGGLITDLHDEIADFLIQVEYVPFISNELDIYKSPTNNTNLVLTKKFNSVSNAKPIITDVIKGQVISNSLSTEPIISITQKVTDLTDLAGVTSKINTVTTPLFVIKRSLIFNKNHIIAKYDLNKKFAIIPNTSAVNSFIKQTTGLEDGVDRIFNLNFALVNDNSINHSTDITRFFKNKLLDMFSSFTVMSTRMEAPLDICFVKDNFGGTRKTLLNMVTEAGDGIITSFGIFKSSAFAFGKIVGEDTIDVQPDDTKLQSKAYTYPIASNGRLENMDLIIGNNITNIGGNPQKSFHAIPDMEEFDTVNEWIEKKSIIIKKDIREKIGVSVTFQFTNKNNLFFYPDNMSRLNFIALGFNLNLKLESFGAVQPPLDDNFQEVGITVTVTLDFKISEQITYKNLIVDTWHVAKIKDTNIPIFQFLSNSIGEFTISPKAFDIDSSFRKSPWST